jgi:hypothetical protein
LLGLKDLELDPLLEEGGMGEAGAEGGRPESGLEGGGADVTAGDASPDGAIDSPAGEAGDEGGGGVDGGDDAPADAPADSPVDAPAEASGDAGCGTLTACGGKCVDLTMDAKNCGSCGHDCLGGGCSLSACQPFPLTHNAQAWDLATDGTNLYWTDSTSSVQKCAIASCTPTPVKTGQNQPERLVYDGAGKIYWTVYGSASAATGEIWSYDGVSAGSLVMSQYEPEGIAFDSNSLYWADTVTNQIAKSPRAGGTSTPFAPSQSTPISIAIDSGSAYWTDSGSGAVQKCSTANCSASAIATGQAVPWGLAVDANYVFWTNLADTGSVWRSDHNGASAAQLGGTQAHPLRIVSDGSHVYWTNQGTTAASFTDGSVMQCPVASCNSPTPIAKAANTPSGIASDSKAVYYCTYGDKTLWMMAK